LTTLFLTDTGSYVIL